MEKNRNELEQTIVALGQQVKMSLENIDWVYSDELDRLIDGWYDLVRYYESHNDDTVISVIVLREYLDPTRLLRKLLLVHDDLTHEQREHIEEQLGSLEICLENIIREVGTDLNNLDNH